MKPLHVLIVDDEPGMLRAVERILSRQYEVTCVSRPDEALHVVESLRPDLALIDIRMPEMSGFDLLERLKQVRPEMDVIIMTGSVHELDRKLVRAIRSHAYYFIQKPFDREVLLALVDRAAETRRLEEQNRRFSQRLQRELVVARRFLRSLLPAQPLVVGRLTASGCCLPCNELGGDFYDFAAVGRDALTVLIADASGHGVSASMLTGVVKSAFHASWETDYEPLSVIQNVAASLATFGPSRFVSVLCVRGSAETGEWTYCNAGHPSGILLRPDRPVELLESTGPLICSGLENCEWSAARLPLRPADRLVLYTDGVADVDGEGGRLGEARLREVACAAVARGTPLLDALLEATRQHGGERPPDDDRTLVTVELN